MLSLRFALCFVALSLAGCSPSPPKSAVRFRTGCIEAVGQGVATGKADAGFIARANLSFQAQDLKGFMLNDGYRSVARRAPERVVCRPYSLGLGLTQCVAKGDVCGL